ncbi:MAG TPA: hypothetical protein VN604_06400 [Nitrospirota bacterium]|nr:hypothetical protein [Nitrospirota bacterium]
MKRFDKRLDITFSGEKGAYEIIGVDRRGKEYLIKTIPLGQLNELGKHTLQELYDSSPHKQGGARAMNRRIDRMIEEEENREERQMQDTLDHATSEAYDLMKRRTGMTQTLPGEESKYFSVKDKRRSLESGIAGEN